MLKKVSGKKIKLEGFNNLTKNLSFNIYDVCYAKSKESQLQYLEYIDEEYNSEKLYTIVEEVTRIIDAKLVNVSTQDYEPRGASVTALINEYDPWGHMHSPHNITAHLDKSHITAHTYPEFNTETGIATFRVDIDVSTCGMISPLRTLHYLIENFESDIVLMDYRVRGFTRDSKGHKIYIDHDITSIQDYIDDDVLKDFLAYDINIVSANMFHTRMMRKKLSIDDYTFGTEIDKLTPKEKRHVKNLLKVELQEIFECQNI